MSTLTSEAIKVRLKENDFNRRLIISPLLEEAEQIKAGQASVDVRLGFEFCLVSPSSFSAIGEFQEDGSINSFSPLYRQEYVPLGSSIVIHPHQFMLAQTLEYIRLPSDLMAYVVGRSTWGRLGLIIATAVGIHPGFAGSLTLELRNLGETPLTLHPGQTIAQLFFQIVVDEKGNPSTTLPNKAQYVGTVDMIPRKLSSNDTHETLSKLIKRYKEQKSS